MCWEGGGAQTHGEDQLPLHIPQSLFSSESSLFILFVIGTERHREDSPAFQTSECLRDFLIFDELSRPDRVLGL